MHRRMFIALVASITIQSTAFAQGDPKVIDKIIVEGKNNSHVMDFLDHLAVKIGPRLTGSSRLLEANNWTRQQFADMGMPNAHLFKWGEIPVGFDRGPSKMRMTKPVEQDFEFTTRSFTAGTDGPISGPVVKQPKNMEELEAMKDKLKGAWVLAKPAAPRGRGGPGGPGGPGAPGGPGRGQDARPNDGAPPRDTVAQADGAPRDGATPRDDAAGRDGAANRDGAPPARGQGRRNRTGAPGSGSGTGTGTGTENAAGTGTDATRGGDNAPPRDGAAPRDGAPPRENADGATSRPARQPQPDPEEPLIKAMYEAGILGRIVASRNDLVITSGARNWREIDMKNLPTEVSITVRRQDYDSINSRLSDGEEVVIEADLQNKFVEGPIPLYDVVAEIPGSEHPEQVVIVSGHLDSWDGPGSQGAQDNGVGSSTTMETARILNAVGIKPKRTIRFCLWSGEEQGLLGSKEYVKSLTADEKAGISAAFIDDGGTDYDGGLQCVANMAPMLTQAVEPVNKAFPDMTVKINTRERMPRGGASDHASFNTEGIPGFFWDEVGSGGQDGKNYTYIHHTQHDIIHYAVPEYLVQSATCAAITAYNLAMADTLLPRYVAPTQTEESADTGPFTVTQGPLTGVWEGSVERAQPQAASPTGGQGNGGGGGGRGFGTFTVTIEMSAENHLRGTSESRMGQIKMTGGTFDPKSNAVTWKIRNEFMGTVTYKGTLEGETITGTLSNEDGEFNLPFKLTRTSKEVPPSEDKPAAGKASGEQPVAAPAKSNAGS